jgi:hypothetical protein
MFTHNFPRFHVRDLFGIVATAAVILFIQMFSSPKPDVGQLIVE